MYGIGIGIEYIRKKKFYNMLFFNLEELDQKYLIREVIEEPSFEEGKLLVYILEQTDKSMVENVKTYQIAQIENIDNIVDLMIDICLQEAGTVPINGSPMPVEVVKSKFLKLNSSHIEYIMDSLDRNPSEVKNIRSYLLTTIYNAPNTISQYYRSQVNYDMSRWEE